MKHMRLLPAWGMVVQLWPLGRGAKAIQRWGQGGWSHCRELGPGGLGCMDRTPLLRSRAMRVIGTEPPSPPAQTQAPYI